MATLRIHREEATNTVILRLEGSLDGAAALMLRQALDEVTAPKLVIDFSRIRDFQDMAVAVLSPALVNRDLKINGLDLHRARMFRYFGVRTEERVVVRAEELISA